MSYDNKLFTLALVYKENACQTNSFSCWLALENGHHNTHMPFSDSAKYMTKKLSNKKLSENFLPTYVSVVFIALHSWEYKLPSSLCVSTYIELLDLPCRQYDINFFKIKHPFL